MKKFLVSVVVPIYNTERYLRETIESVVSQTIGFEKNIQLILVNNDTEDNSEIICKEFEKIYPNNVVYIKVLENHGPCSARNAGLRAATAEYINFLDSDDKWEVDALEKLVCYLEKHRDNVDFVAARIRHFDAFDDYDLFDYKFSDGDKIVDIRENPSYVQFSLCSVLLKTEVAKRYVHDERIRHAEDMKYLTEILFERCKYGLVSSAVFYYRMRLGKDSTLDTTAASDNWYTDTIKYSYLYLIEYSKEKYGKVIPYLQYILLSEVRGRLEKQIPSQYDGAFVAAYKKRIKILLNHIDDELIINEPHLIAERKLFALRLKYGRELKNHLTHFENKIFFDGTEVFDLRKMVFLRTVLVIEDMVIITGFLRYVADVGNVRLKFNTGFAITNKVFFEELKDKNDIYSLNTKICKGKSFRLCMPFVDGEAISFIAEIGNHNYIQQQIQFLDFHTINEQLFNVSDDYILMTGENGNAYPTYYVFPFEKVGKGSRICIYGYGYIGRQFLRQIETSGYCNVVAVVDKNNKDYQETKSDTDFICVEQLTNYEFDQIVISNGRREVASEIVDYLIGLGFSKEKLVVGVNRGIPWS